MSTSCFDRLLVSTLVLGTLVAGGCWNREAVWEATDAHRAAVVRPGESEAERLYRHGRDCMDTLERDDCALDFFEQLIALEPDRRDLVADATFRLVEIYRRRGKADDATLLLRKFWDVGMEYASAGVLPYGSRFAPETITTLFMVDVERLQASGLHASLPEDAKDMMFTCDEARREQLTAAAKQRREAREAQKLAEMSEQEQADYEKRRKRMSFGRKDGDESEDGDKSEDDAKREEEERTVYGGGGFCALAAALGVADPRDFTKFLGGQNHADAGESLGIIRVDELETKLAAAVEAGRIVAEATPEIEGRDPSTMTSIMRDKLRVWSLAGFEFRGEPVYLLSLDRNELTMAPKALVPGLLHARAHDQTRLSPELRGLIEQVPREVMFTTLVTPAAMSDFMGEMGAMGRLLPKAQGVLIAAVVYDYAGLFVRFPTEDSVKAWVLLSIARKMIANDDEGARAGNEDFMGNLDISQTRDGKALLMTNILTRNAITQMFLGG